MGLGEWLPAQLCLVSFLERNAGDHIFLVFLVGFWLGDFDIVDLAGVADGVCTVFGG